MRLFIALVFAVLLPATALAHQKVSAGEAFIVDTTPGMANAAGYVDLLNEGNTTATLTGVSFGPASEGLAAEVQIHTHIMDGDLMRMAQIPEPLVMESGEAIVMAPGGIHVMLLGLSEPLIAGGVVEIILHLEGDHTRDLRVQIPILSADEVPLSKILPMGGDDDHESHDEHGNGHATEHGGEDHSGHNH